MQSPLAHLTQQTLISIQPYPFPMNTLYYGDNLKILLKYIEAESLDVVYLDPPFNYNRHYRTNSAG
jgi:16S rRNA G966 N2-methylase RsmD